MKIAFHTLGCKVNQYDTQAIREAAIANGFVETEPETADVIVVNSCTVTATADRKSRQAVSHMKKLNPNAIVVLAGCYPQALFEKNQSIKSEADIIIGNANTKGVIEAIEDFNNTKQQKAIECLLPHNKTEAVLSLENPMLEDKTRAFLKIEDGCNRFCKYCIIPYARGRVRSKKLEDVVKEAEKIALNGYKEIVLCGINLTAYGSDFENKKTDIGDVVSALNKIDGIERIRLGSMEPDQITDDIIDKWERSNKLCPQFHISLQSGCDSTLKRMGRHYNTDEYYRLTELLKSSFDNCTLTTDIMVGFPGETDEEFESTLGFVQKVGFFKVHIFRYSKRNGTPAAEMENQVVNTVKIKRAAALSSVSKKVSDEYLKGLIGTTQKVLFETVNDDNICSGHTDNYILVNVKCDDNICGKILPVTIKRIRNNEAFAEVII